jgi:hypothetical protein
VFGFSKRQKSSVFLVGSVSPRNRVSTTTIVRSELSEHQARMKSEGMNELFKRSVKGVRRKRRKEEHRVGQGLDHYINFFYIAMYSCLTCAIRGQHLPVPGD